MCSEKGDWEQVTKTHDVTPGASDRCDVAPEGLEEDP